MSPLEQQLRWWSEQLGWAGLSALALVFYALLLYVFAIVPTQQQLLQLEQDIVIAQKRSQSQQAQTQAQDASENSLQERFYNDFPHKNDMSKALDTLFAAARASDLILQRGEYKLKRDPQTQILRYEIELPLQGTYPAIQRFTYQALTDLPTLALDEISFKREAANDALVQAKLHFTLYLLEQ